MRAIAAGMSDVGLQREHNEDSFVVLKEYDLFVVADGMGGHRAGDVASKLATDTISEFFKSTANEDVTWPFHFDTNLSEEENRLLTGIRVANRQIFERSTRSREYHGMGTTATIALLVHSEVHFGQIGDSRGYVIRDGKARQLTKDQSLVQRLIELRKESWSVAFFPVENHGFEEETSWADEYKRILKLFDDNLKSGTAKRQT